MLIFNCSNAATDAFTVTRQGKKETIIEHPPAKSIEFDIENFRQVNGKDKQVLSHWVLHAFRAERKLCIAAMEFNTRYSMVIIDQKKGDITGFLEKFITRFTQGIRRYGLELDMLGNKSSDEIYRSYLSKHPEVNFYNRTNRSVQSHINDVIWHFKFHVKKNGYLPKLENEIEEIDDNNNEIIRKTKYDKEWFVPREKMFACWMIDFNNASQNGIDKLYKKIKEYNLKDFDKAQQANKQEAYLINTKSTKHHHSNNCNVISLAAFKKKKRIPLN